MIRCFVLLVSLVVLLSGCTTMTKGDNKTVVMVLSNPSGADIFWQGQKMGETPDYVRLPRERDGQTLELKLGKETRAIPLKSKYRWKHSFLFNFMFLNFAPVGWVWDFANESAYDLSSPPVTEFTNGQRDKDKNLNLVKSMNTIVVAPPQGVDGLLGREIGARIVEHVKGKFPDSKVIDFEKSESWFRDQGVDNFSRGTRKRREVVYKEFRAYGVTWSKVKRKKRLLIVKIKYINTFSEKKIFEETEDWPLDSFKQVKERKLVRDLRRKVFWVPNTITVETGGSKGQVMIDGQEYDAIQEKQSGPVGELLTVVSSFGLRYFSAPTRRKEWKWGYSWIPSVSANIGHMKFEQGPGVQGLTVSTKNLVIGYGAELFYESSRGRVYFDVVPGIGWQELSYWEEAGLETSLNGGYIGLISEIGYLYFFNEHWSLRLFTRFTAGNEELWAKLVEDRAAGHEIEDVNTSYGGGAIGYTIALSELFGK